jgi:hypothetical protein
MEGLTGSEGDGICRQCCVISRLGYRFCEKRVLLFNRGSRLVDRGDVMRQKAVVTHLPVMSTPTFFLNTNFITSQFIEFSHL